MDTYYRKSYRKGRSYEEFLEERCTEFGFILDIYKDMEEQYNIGESKHGVEIKFDEKFSSTNNLYIEYAERTSTNKEYRDSGILRNDNTWLWMIGDQNITFLFTKKMLKKLMNENIESKDEPGYYYKRQHITTPTSKGYLISIDDAFENCEKVIFHTNKYMSYKNNIVYTDLSKGDDEVL